MNARDEIPWALSRARALPIMLAGCVLALLFPALAQATVIVTGTAVSGMFEGNPFTSAVATFTSDDPQPQLPGSYTASIDWGDGSAASAGTIAGPTLGVLTATGTHTYAAAGTFAVTVTVTDAVDDSVATGSPANATPGELVVILSGIRGLSVVEGAVFNGQVATYSDPGTADPISSFVATIDWGDGATTAGTMASLGGGSFSVSGTHVYGGEGAYPISVTVDEVAENFPITNITQIVVTEGDVLTPSGLPVSGTARATATSTATAVAVATTDKDAGTTATATVAVAAPPMIAKSFAATSIVNGGIVQRPTIPTLSDWMLGVLVLLLAGASVLVPRRRAS